MPVARMGRVLEHALVRKAEPITWEEPVVPTKANGAGSSGVYAH